MFQGEGLGEELVLFQGEGLDEELLCSRVRSWCVPG